MQSIDKANILLVTPNFPVINAPSTTGGKIFVFNLIKNLSAKYDIYLISRIERGELEYVSYGREYCKEVYIFPKRSINLRMLLHQMKYWYLFPSNLFYYHDPNIARKIREVVQDNKMDVLQFEFTSTGQYVKKSKFQPTILNEHDVTFVTWRNRYMAEEKLLPRLIKYLQYRLMKKYELSIINSAALVFVRSEGDRQELLKYVSSDRVKVFTQGVDDGFFKVERHTSQELSLLFIGAFQHKPNVDAVVYFIESIYPKILSRVPDSKIYIVGSNPPSSIRSLQNENTIVAGYVADIKPYLSTCHVFVAPITWGGGVKVKILEAMAGSIPVVTTQMGAYGLEVKHGEHLFIEKDEDDFANRVVELFNNRELNIAIGKRGRDYVRLHHSWKNIMDKMIEVYDSLRENHCGEVKSS